MEAMQILGDPEAYEPKLGRHPGKTHSNVNVTVQSFKSSKRRSDETNDEEDGESSDAPRPAKKRSSMPSKQDSGFEDSSADADLAKVKTVEARPTSHAPVNQANSDDESDLEIEPPVSS